MDNGWVLAGYLVTLGGIALYTVLLLLRARNLTPPPPADPADSTDSADPER